MVQATNLFYVDVQRMLKRLRADGFSVRYMCAGEFGEKKGRAHWHIVLFFSGVYPEIPFERRIDWKYWPHGFTYAQGASYDGFSYLLKYTLKDDQQRMFRKVLRLSKKPPLGTLFFYELAERMVKAGLAVHSPEYSFATTLGRCPDGVYRPRKFWLRGKSLEMFLSSYYSLWVEAHGSPPPDTEYFWEKYYDPIAKAELDADEADFSEVVEERRKASEARVLRKYVLPLDQQGFLLLPHPYAGVVVRYSDNSVHVVIGDQEPWLLSGIESGRNGELSERSSLSIGHQLLRCGLPWSLCQVVKEWLSRRSPEIST